MTITWNIGKVNLTKETSIIKKSGHKGKGKGRSEQTYKNKLNKIKRYYKNLVKASKKAKKKGKARSFYFHEKYKTFEQYIKVLNIKEASK